MEFSRELRDDVLAGEITLSVRLWKRPQVKEGGRYRVGPGLIEIDAVELLPFAAITEADVRLAGEPDRETLRARAAHAGRSTRTRSSTGSSSTRWVPKTEAGSSAPASGGAVLYKLVDEPVGSAEVHP